MIIGMAAGVVFGVMGIQYFGVTDLLDQVCLVASGILVFQLLGSTIGGSLGKPHEE